MSNSYINEISKIIEDKRDKYVDISDKIWNFAEIRFEEFQSAELLCTALESEGFQVEKGVADLETAFIGSYGSGKPVIAFLGEYDALSGLSQKGGAAMKAATQEGGNGHGCGHNLLGTGSFAAAVALRDYMEKHNIPGTIRFYGCPAEEGGSGKTLMVRAGLFDDVDFALCWHPADHNLMMCTSSLANVQASFKFTGRSAHAAQAPHLGRSALDAVELMNVGVNYLREHIIPEARVHYAVTNTGGLSPNIVQADASVLYLVRAPKTNQVNEIYERVCKIAEGAALMTGTNVEIIFDKACSNLVPNHTMQQIMFEQFTQLGTPQFSEQDYEFATEIRKTLSEQEKNGGGLAAIPVFRELLAKEKDTALSTTLFPYNKAFTTITMPGSTDVGDVSWVVPTAQCTTTCHAQGTQLHSWQAVATGTTSIAHKGMLHAGKVMAATAAAMLAQPELIEQAKQELKERLGNEIYQNPIPQDVNPSHIRKYSSDIIE
ncbi:amidohydrolase [Lysinibacillus agricola]|uniref:Amidohydrolase n=1 Tax=Lysinibacillus agricola TaxID=2590012 RepID=A0ABX7AW96_9BACI|nr:MULTISPECIES: M20 family metallopeptidase [Lysinibacillus]KOS63595.1 amidohydrolase [Lysinibacillus sp. FJAT-14222]QQP14076.1 amidohydrolase [Lysinibacillus agricola]